MGHAQKSNILRASIAANAIALVVVELESLARRAASAVRGLKRALTSVALPHEAPYRGGDTAHTGRRVSFLKTFSRVFRLAEALGFEPFELVAEALAYRASRRRSRSREDYASDGSAHRHLGQRSALRRDGFRSRKPGCGRASYSIDVNILLYSSDASSPFHERALEFMESCAENSEPAFSRTSPSCLMFASRRIQGSSRIR